MLKKSILTVILVLCMASISISDQRIIAGYDGHGDVERLDLFKANGLNTHFRSIDFATKMKLRLDGKGRVVSDGIDKNFERSLRNYIQEARKRDINIYFVVSFTKKRLEQLRGLGKYDQAVIQGPTRYFRSGQKPAPAPFEKKYWLGQLLQEALFVAELSKEYPNVKGLLVDVEMYAGEIMWRNHSSFDDATFEKVTKQMGIKNIKNIKPGNRYKWLLLHSLLERYFAAEEDLAVEMAKEFRQEVDKVNPDLQLGLLPYDANWFYDGWTRGFATGKPEVLVCSEHEYGTGYISSSMAKAQRLKKKIGNVRYLPGLLPKYHSPKMFAYHAAKYIEQMNGYWIFTTYSFTQTKPEKLWGAYLLQADRHQYLAELKKSNFDPKSVCDEKFELPESVCNGYSLLTGNKYYEGPAEKLPLKVKYNPQPDVEMFKADGGRKLFDGCVLEPFATVAWYAKKDREVEALIDLSEKVYLEKIVFTGLTQLANFTGVKKGKLTIFTSLDGKMYYPLMDRLIADGVTNYNKAFVFDDLGIKARYIKVQLKALDIKNNSVLVMSEVAAWGKRLEK